MKKQVALTLSCGGARGLAHIGVIRELERRGYVITAVSGCSIGALIGAFYAMGKLDELEKFMRSLTPDDITAYVDFTLSGYGFIKAQRFIEKMKEFAPDCDMARLPVKLTIVATNLTTGRAEIFTRGSVYRAVRASIAIPAVITSVEKRGEHLVDGSIVEPIPLRWATPRRNEIGVAVNLYAKGETISTPAAKRHSVSITPFAYLREKYHAVRTWRSYVLNYFFSDTTKRNGYVRTIRSIVDLMTQRLIEKNLEANPPDVLVEIPMTCASVFDFFRADALITLGQRRTAQALDVYEQENGGWKRLFRRWRRRKA